MNTLFDENGLLNVGDVVANHPSYLSIMEDGIVTDDELREQADRVIASLHHIQDICSPEQQQAVLDAIAEISVLYAVYHNYELQDIRR